MIAVDSCVVIPFLAGIEYPETILLTALLEDARPTLCPVTVSELLSAVRGAEAILHVLEKFDVLDLSPGYWERTGLLRAAARRLGRRAAMADALIAQACIDADVPLLTRDEDFKIFAEIGGLKLA